MDFFTIILLLSLPNYNNLSFIRADLNQNVIDPSANRTVIGIKELWSKVMDQPLNTWGINITFSSDGQVIATSCLDGTIIILDAASGMKKMALRGHINGVHQLAFQPKGKKFFSSDGHFISSGIVKIWEFENKEEVTILHPHRQLISWALHPDGKLLITSGNNKPPDDKRLKIWDITTGKMKDTLSAPGPVRPLVFCPNGKMIAGVDVSAKIIRFWDLDKKEQLRPLTFEIDLDDYVRNIFFDLGGKGIIVARGKKIIQKIEVVSGKEILQFPRPNTHLMDLVYSPDGKLLVGSFKGPNPQLIFWNPASGQEIIALKNLEITGLAFSPDSKFLACLTRASVHLYEIEKKEK